MADDLRRQHAARIPQARICRDAASPRHRRCKTAGTQGTCTDLQGTAYSVLREIWIQGRGRVRQIHARQCCMASDAPGILTNRDLER